MIVELVLIFVATLAVGVAAFVLVRQARATTRATQRMEDAVNRLVNIVANPDQAWYWAPEWQAREREADEAIAEGRLIGPMTGDEFLAWLDRVHAEAEEKTRAVA